MSQNTQNSEKTKMTLSQRLMLNAKAVKVDAETQEAIDSVLKVLDKSETGTAVFPLASERNCSTQGYLIVSIDDFNKGCDSVGIVIWKGQKSRKMIIETIEGYGAELDADRNTKDAE